MTAVPPRSNSEDAQSVRDLLRASFPIPPPAESGYVTHLELNAAICHVETKIVNSELRLQKYVLVGCLSVILAFGGGYMSIVSKLDRLTEAMPQIVTTLDGRKSWILRKDVRDDKQDGAIKIAVPSYNPAPYVEPPK